MTSNRNTIKHTEGGEGETIFRTITHAGQSFTPTGEAYIRHDERGPYLEIRVREGK